MNVNVLIVASLMLLGPFPARAQCPGGTCATPVGAPGNSFDPYAQSTNTPTSSALGSSLETSGAAGDGVTDDAAKINRYLAAFTKGGRVSLPAGKQYLIGSANLLVPPNVTLEGLSSPQSPDAVRSLAGASGFILNPAYTITLGSGAQLRDLYIRRAGMIANPSAAQVIAAVAQWGSEHSVAVTIPANIGGAMLFDLFIEGFNTCATAHAGDFSMQWISGDCYNGLEVSSAGDNHYIDNVRWEPYYALATPVTSGSWSRPGIAFYLHDGNTGTVLTRAFSFMYASGILLSNVGVTQIANSGFEWQATAGNGITGTKGIRWINHNSGTSAANTYSFGFDTPMSDEGVGEVIMTGIQAPASATGPTFNLGGQPAVPVTISLGGSVSAGSTATVRLKSSALAGSPLSLTYTARDADTASAVADGLAKLINTKQALIATGVFAGVSSAVVTIGWPADISVMVDVAVTGGLRSSSGSGVQPAGSYGSVIGANTTGSDGIHPIYKFGPHVFSWNIEAPFTGDNILPNNWALVDPNSIGRVAFTGIHWSADPSLSNCGGGSPGLSGTASDAGGTITEGTNATGCTLQFRTPWPWTPDCTVTSPTGSAISGYRVTPAGLVITNSNGTKGLYTYRCSL